MTSSVSGRTTESRPRRFRPRERDGAEPYRVVLVGPGRRGLRTNGPAVDAVDGLQLAAVVDDIVGVGRREALSRWPQARVGHHLVSAIDRLRPDLAIVATPHDSHVSIGVELLGQCIPTVIEKPLARGSAELRRLIRACERSGTPLATVQSMRHADDFQDFIGELKVMRSGDIRIDATVASYQGLASWRQSRRRSGGGVLLDLGYHYLDMLCWQLGAPVIGSVELGFPQQRHSDDVEHSARVELTFRDGKIRVHLDLRASDTESPHIKVEADGRTLVKRTYAKLRSGSTYGLQSMTRQLACLVADGFLDGRGDWREDLPVQVTVLGAIDEIYARARAEEGAP